MLTRTSARLASPVTQVLYTTLHPENHASHGDGGGIPRHPLQLVSRKNLYVDVDVCSLSPRPRTGVFGKMTPCGDSGLIA